MDPFRLRLSRHPTNKLKTIQTNTTRNSTISSKDQPLRAYRFNNFSCCRNNLASRSSVEDRAWIIIKSPKDDSVKNSLPLSQGNSLRMHSPVINARWILRIIGEIIPIMLITAHMQDIVTPQLVAPVKNT